MRYFKGMIFSLCVGCKMLPDSYVVIESAAGSVIEEGFEFSLSSPKVEPGEQVWVSWNHHQDLDSMSVFLFHQGSEDPTPLIKIHGIKDKTISFEVRDVGAYSVQLVAQTKSKKEVSSHIQSLEAVYSDARRPNISYEKNMVLTLGVAVHISPSIGDTQKAQSLRCTIEPSLPSGLSLDTSSCSLSGTPMKLSPQKSYVVTAENDLGQTSSADFHLAVTNNRTLSYDFVGTHSLSPFNGPALRFDRASEATYFDANGQLRTVTDHTPRFEHMFLDGVWQKRGLIVNPQGTNIAWPQHNFTSSIQWNYNHEINVASDVTSPIDEQTMISRITPTIVDSVHMIGSSSDIRGYCNNHRHCRFQALIKSDGIVKVRLGQGSPSSSLGERTVDFDLLTGAFYRLGSLTGTDSVSPPYALALADGWWLLDWGFGVSTLGGFVSSIRLLSDTGEYSWLGDSSKALLVGYWHTYSDTRHAVPRSIIPTTNAAVTHLADKVFLDGTSFVEYYNEGKGSFDLSFEALGFSGTQGLLSVNDSTANNRMELLLVEDKLRLLVVKDGTTVVDHEIQSLDRMRVYRLRWSYAQDAFMVRVDDSIAHVVQGPFDLPVVHTLLLGSGVEATTVAAHIREFHYVPNTPVSALSWWEY
jgi:hypothetical protein